MKKKDSFLKIIIAIFFSLNLLLTFFGTFIIFSLYNEYDYVIKDVVEKSIENLKEDYIDENSNQSSTFEVDKTPTEEDVVFHTLYKESYYYNDWGNKESFEKVREYVPFDLYTLADFEIKENKIDRQYVVYDQNSENRDYEAVEFILQKEDVKIEACQGFYPTGGTCTETFEMQTGVGELSVCIYESSPDNNSYTVGLFKSEEDISGLSLNYEFYFQGNYSRVEIEKIFSSITRIEE